MPERALLNDINSHVINFYSWLKRGLTIDIPLVNAQTEYYEHRRRFNELLAQGLGDTAEAAALFYYMNKTGYNGLCRFNRRGQFNVPFGQHRKVGYRREFMAYTEAFDAWEFTARDFSALQVEDEDFIYADPPYDVDFRQYAQGGFDWDQQVAAATWLSEHRGPVVLANQATSRIVTLYESLGFGLQFLTGPRRISCTGDRAPAQEVLAYRNLGA